jgi:hypothetical protein
MHDRGAVVLDGALVDAKVRRDILVGVAGEDQLHDLALPRSEARDAIGCVLSPGEQVAQDLLLLD